MRKILEFYRRESTVSFTPMIVMGVISGIAQAMLLGIITIAADTASHEDLNVRFFLMYAIAFALMYIGRRYTLKQGTRLTEHLIKNLRVRISDKIRKVDLVFLEHMGAGELYSRLANDTTIISQTAVIIINAFQSLLIVVFSLIFIGILSKVALVITIIALWLGVMNYLSQGKHINQELYAALGKESRFFDIVNQILLGFKELKMNQKKSDDYFGFLQQLATETRDLKITTGFRLITIILYSQTFSTILLGVIVFILPRFEEINAESIIRITAAVLFLMGPMSSFASSISAFSQASAAIDHLYVLESELDRAHAVEAAETASAARPIDTFETLTLEQLAFSYTDPTGTPLFTVGPVDLTIRRGEILFLIGGNGSGKTTLLKLLTGLYLPHSGVLKVDNMAITPAQSQVYRELFGIIFSDFHLFDRLYGLDQIDHDAVNAMLRLMELDQKTTLIDHEFSTIQLSTGQRKRLALIIALLDNRPVYVFDEWAADQDPHFRQYFYEVLLQKLQSEGKTIIAVSHDDRYFHVADRVVKMEYGQFVPFEVAPKPTPKRKRK